MYDNTFLNVVSVMMYEWEKLLYKVKNDKCRRTLLMFFTPLAITISYIIAFVLSFLETIVIMTANIIWAFIDLLDYKNSNIVYYFKNIWNLKHGDE